MAKNDPADVPQTMEEPGAVTQVPEQRAAEAVPAPVDESSQDTEPVVLVVKSNNIANFLYHRDEMVDEPDPETGETRQVERSVPYTISRDGTEVPADVAGSIIDSALASGVLVTTKD